MTKDDIRKNRKNAALAKKMSPGTRVMVIATGETGEVTKVIEYNRENLNSPCGYSAIQVRFDDYENLPHHKKVRRFSSTSLKILPKK